MDTIEVQKKGLPWIVVAFSRVLSQLKNVLWECTRLPVKPWAEYLVGDFWLVGNRKPRWKVKSKQKPCGQHALLIVKKLCQLIDKQNCISNQAGCMLGRSCDPKVPYIDQAHCHFQSFLYWQPCKLKEEKKRLIHTRHCKYVQVWCLGLFGDSQVKVLPSN